MPAKKRGRPKKVQETKQRTPSVTRQASASSVLEAAENGSEKHQAIAVILFAFSLFLLFLAFIKGKSLWQFLHNALFGVFGICAFILPFILFYLALTFAKEIKGRVFPKIMQSVILTALFGAAVHIFSKQIFSESVWDFIAKAYIKGVNFSGGGVLGAVIGEPLVLAFTKIGAVLLLLILGFVFYMLVTGTPLLKFFGLFSKTAKKVAPFGMGAAKGTGSSIGGDRVKANFPFDLEIDSSGPLPDVCDFDIITDMPDHPVYSDLYITDDQEAKRRKLIDIVKGKDIESEKPKKKPEPKPEKEKTIKTETFLEIAENGYRFPPITLLDEPVAAAKSASAAELNATGLKLVETLRSFGVETQITDISRGPSVTRYELKPAAGVKISKITNLADDIALNLASAGVRIEAPIPGKAAVGIEIPNKHTSMVKIRELIDSPEFLTAKSKLSIALGKDIAGKLIIADIAKMPHTLIAGATGSGKSVCINAIILSILYKASPSDVRLLMIDPKVVELGIYNSVPHLLVPVVTDPRKASGALGWAVTEMLNRYKLFSENNVRDLDSYNELARLNETITPLPKIVIMIDELADLMMVAPNEVEDSIMRLAQMARAAGMHLIIATQRPSVDVITGTIKSNIPSRIAFAVSAGVDSRTILDQIGAEKLIGKGDMLFSPVGSSKPIRIQGCFVGNREIESVVGFIKNSETADYDEDIMEEIEKQAAAEKGTRAGSSPDDGEGTDELLPKAIECVIDAGTASTSYLQRKLKLGYARAARLIDEMEERGIIGEYEGSKPRQVLITRQQWFEMQNASSDL